MGRQLPLTLKLRLWRLVDLLGPRRLRIKAGPATGLVLVAPPSCRASYAWGRYEPHVVEALDRMTRPEMVALDVGSHLGYHTLTLARRVGNRGRVYAFEPVPRHAHMLRRTLLANSLHQVTVIEKAVTDRTGRVTVEESPNPGVTRVIGQTDEPRGGRRFQVAATSLDDWAEQGADLERLDVLKLDAEGQELAALQGSAGLLSRHRPVVICEIHRFAGVPYAARELVSWLSDAGYDLERIPSRSETAGPLGEAIRRLDRMQTAPDEVAVLHVLALPRSSA